MKAGSVPGTIVRSCYLSEVVFGVIPIVQIKSLRQACLELHELEAGLEPRESVLSGEQR